MRRTLLALAALASLLAGCGQSGPLYLPGNPSEIKSAPPPQEQAETEDDAEKPEG